MLASHGPWERYARIFTELAALPLGGTLRLVNDHDPRPLWYQLQAERPGRFRWSYQEQGPERWMVRIERMTDAGDAGQATEASPGAETAPPTSTSGSIQLDNRGLEPPQPLVRILEALERLTPGAELTSHLDRERLLEMSRNEILVIDLDALDRFGRM